MTLRTIAALILVLAAGLAFAQTKPHAKPSSDQVPVATPAPDPEPTMEETYEYIRGKLLTLATEDPRNAITFVSFENATCTLKTIDQGGRKNELLIGNLDTNNLAWEIYDPNTGYSKQLRITLLARVGKTGGTQSLHDKVTANELQSVPLAFSLTKAAEVPDFQTKMIKAFTHLIVLCGGPAPKELF